MTRPLRIHVRAEVGPCALCRRRPPPSRLVGLADAVRGDCLDCRRAVRREEARGGRLPGDLTPGNEVG